MPKIVNKFYKISEHNEWEGETWHFYIPADVNVEAIAVLKRGIMVKDVEDEYVIHDKMLDEVAVDVLVEQDDDDGYMAKHNKLSGKLSIFKIQEALESSEEHALHSLLYKGRSLT